MDEAPGPIVGWQEYDRNVDALVFDVDGTLYDHGAGLLEQLRERIFRLLSTVTGLNGAEAEQLFSTYTRKYGLAVLGLTHEYNQDLQEMLAVTHQVDYERFLLPALELRRLIIAADLPAIAFSNSPIYHVKRVLEATGLANTITEFVTIEDFVAMRGSSAPQTFVKPDPRAFAVLSAKTGLDYRRVVFFEDQPGIAAAAFRQGVRTVLVGPLKGESTSGVPRFDNLKQALRALAYDRSAADSTARPGHASAPTASASSTTDGGRAP
jgi:pyrimidine 5'-nucleotidase